MKKNPAPIDIEMARKGLDHAKRAIKSGDYDMLILDEINVAMDFKLIPVEEVLEMLTNRPHKIDLILTSRYAPEEIIEIADMVSEIEEVKHHYNADIKNRAGIEC